MDCYIEQAITQSDPTVCDKPINANDEKICRAVYEGDVESCDRITNSPSHKDECIKRVAETLGDPSLCKRIQSPREESECIREASKT
jgi:hypothetical protein